MFPDPTWPIIVLVAIVAFDIAVSIGPTNFVRGCYNQVNLPERFWGLLLVIKTASVAGLVVGLWTPWLALITSICLVLYFICAIGAHFKARAFGRTLYLNASGMLVINVAVLLICFVF